QFRPVRATVAALVSAEQGIVKALREEKRDPLAAVGEYLTSAEQAAKQLAETPNDIAARDDYKFAVARAIGTIQKAKLEPWTEPLRVPAAGGGFLLPHRPGPPPPAHPAPL